MTPALHLGLKVGCCNSPAMFTRGSSVTPGPVNTQAVELRFGGQFQQLWPTVMLDGARIAQRGARHSPQLHLSPCSWGHQAPDFIEIVAVLVLGPESVRPCAHFLRERTYTSHHSVECSIFLCVYLCVCMCARVCVCVLVPSLPLSPVLSLPAPRPAFPVLKWQARPPLSGAG